jgi:hypothetical protein
MTAREAEVLRFEDSLPRLRMAHGAALREAIRDRYPVIVEDLAASWPALREWTAEALGERFGDRSVRVYDASFGAPGPDYMGSIDSMPFRDFLRATQSEGRDLRMFLYNLSRQVPELLDDLGMPDIGLRFSRRFIYSFFGCRGSTTPLHYDIDMGDVLHTAIRGRRRIRLFAPGDSVALYRHPCTVRSYVDLDAPDVARFPALAGLRGQEFILEAGQSLYMPAGWWHEFHYLDAGMGVSYRAPSPRWSDRLCGALNLLVASPFDRLANRLAPAGWFAWKCRRAQARAALRSRTLSAPAGGAS